MPQHHLKVDSQNAGLRLDVFLTQKLSQNPSRSFIKKLIDGGHVRVNETLVKPHYKMAQDDQVLIEIPPDFLTPSYIEPEEIPLNIFYEDESLLVINKPAGMLVHPAKTCYTGTLVNALLHRKMQLSDINSEMRPGIVHRLDRETSGLMLVAKDNITHARLAKQFERRIIKKRYVALVDGEIDFDEGLVDAPIGRHPFHYDKKTVEFSEKARESKTYYRVIKRHQGATLVALFPQTGRTHQLRVHMVYLHHPILGDDKYGKKSLFPRLALHAQSIGFIHPVHKSFIEFSTPIPQEFRQRVEL